MMNNFSFTKTSPFCLCSSKKEIRSSFFFVGIVQKVPVHIYGQNENDMATKTAFTTHKKKTENKLKIVILCCFALKTYLFGK